MGVLKQVRKHILHDGYRLSRPQDLFIQHLDWLFELQISFYVTLNTIKEKRFQDHYSFIAKVIGVIYISLPF